jgi:hypothetical protein
LLLGFDWGFAFGHSSNSRQLIVCRNTVLHFVEFNVCTPSNKFDLR